MAFLIIKCNQILSLTEHISIMPGMAHINEPKCFIFTFTLSFCGHFYPKLLTIGEYMKRLILKRQTDRGSAHNTSLRHCSNKYKLAREGEKMKI